MTRHSKSHEASEPRHEACGCCGGSGYTSLGGCYVCKGTGIVVAQPRSAQVHQVAAQSDQPVPDYCPTCKAFSVLPRHCDYCGGDLVCRPPLLHGKIGGDLRNETEQCGFCGAMSMTPCVEVEFESDQPAPQGCQRHCGHESRYMRDGVCQFGSREWWGTPCGHRCKQGSNVDIANTTVALDGNRYPVEQGVARCPECGHAPHDPGGCLNMASDNDCHCGEQDVAPPERKPDNLSRLLSDYSNAAYDCGAYTESEADYRGKLEVWMAARKVVEDFIRTGRAPVAAEPVLTAQSTEDDEIRRMQNGVRDHLILLGVPDSRIDGAGCDSGDPLDFTKAEISQAFNFFEDQHNEQIAAIRKALDACEAHADDIVELNVILRKVDWEALTVLIKGEKKG